MAQPYDPAQRARILAELHRRRAAGESFEALAATPGWPSRPTLRKWLRQAGGPPPPAIRRASVRWSQALAAEVCERFEAYSLREIAGHPGMPDRKTLWQWRRRRPAFHVALEAARRASRQPRTGRRSTYGELIAEDVIDAVFEAGTIAAACREARGGLPPPHTLYDWVRSHPDFAHAIEIAMDMARERRLAPLLDAVRAWLADPDTSRRSAPLPRHIWSKS